MRKNAIVTTDHETSSQLPKAVPTAKYGPKKMNEGRASAKRDSRKLMALQEALQDPITVCEGS